MFRAVGVPLDHLGLAPCDDVERVGQLAFVHDRLSRRKGEHAHALGRADHDVLRHGRERTLGVLELLDVSLSVQHRGRRIADRRRDLLRELRARVAGRVHARDARPHELVGDDVAVRVVRDVVFEQVPAHGLEADEDEHALELVPLAFAVALDVDPLHAGLVAADLPDDRGRDRRHVLHPEQTVLEDGLRAVLVAAMDELQRLREAREEKTLLEGAVAPADDREVISFEERAVADGAVRHAAPVELLLAGNAQLRRLAADGDDDRVRGMSGAVVHLDDLAVALLTDLLHLRVRLDLQTEFPRVLGHFRRELGAGDGLEARIVFDELCVEDLAAGVLGFEQDHVHVRSRRVQTRGEPGGTAADDDHVEISHRASTG